MQFIDRLNQTEVRFDEITGQLADPSVIADSDRYRKVAKSHSELAQGVRRFREWKKVTSELSQARSMSAESDPELKQMAADEVSRLEPEQARIEEELKF